MKILITGSNGQLGNALNAKFHNGNEVYALSSAQLDITDKKSCIINIGEIQPDVVINCAAYNYVDLAETERNKASRVNKLGVSNLAESCKYVQAKLVHISTDYVFDGEANTPYNEEDITNPINYYGYTKLQGEQALAHIHDDYLIIRTSWLYSRSDNNFLATIRKLARTRDSIKVINDQIGTPTNTSELSSVIYKLVDQDARGLYHCTGNGECSWYDFAKKIIKLDASNCLIESISSKEYNQPAKRPRYSVLDNKKVRSTIGDTMGHWEESLERFLGSKDS